MQYASSFKYLGLLLDEHMNSSSLPAICLLEELEHSLAHFYANNWMGFSTFKTLYKVCIANACGYSADVLGYGVFSKFDSVRSLALRWYIGVQKFVPLAALEARAGFNGQPQSRPTLLQVFDHSTITVLYNYSICCVL